MGYFGIVGTNSTDTESNLPFLAIDRERFLEYDVTKLVVTLANQRKSTIGLISGIPVEGSPGMPMMGRQPTPPLLMIDHIKEFFEVKSIAKEAKEIPSDIGVLIVVQPEGLSAELAYAIDQFALSGGKVLAFVDPVPEMQRQGQMMFMMAGPPDLAEFGKLLKTWGVAFDAGKVATDKSRARRVQFGGGPRPSVTDYIVWMGLDRRNLDERDVLAGGIERLNFASAGFLEKAADAKTEFSPIVRTTADAMVLPADAIGMMPDAVALLRNYKRGGVLLVIAARVSGEAKSAFPDGAPVPPAPEAKDKTDATDGAKDKAAETKDKANDKAKAQGAKTPGAKAQDKKTTAGAKAEDKKAEDKKTDEKAEAAKAPPAPPPRLHVASGNINVVVVADSDFLHDQFWVDIREFLGQQVAIPNAHNGSFVLGALENLSGSDALISLRGRGITDRPFELVNCLRRVPSNASRQGQLRPPGSGGGASSPASRSRATGRNGAPTRTARRSKFRGDFLSVRRELRESSASCARTSIVSTACSSSLTSPPCRC
jgi:ABC-type uncharacterized transport system involved in gliding motility auxiliary subunit